MSNLTWRVYDDTGADIFTQDYSSKAAALDAALVNWDHLTASERRRQVGYGIELVDLSDPDEPTIQSIDLLTNLRAIDKLARQLDTHIGIQVFGSQAPEDAGWAWFCRDALQPAPAPFDSSEQIDIWDLRERIDHEHQTIVGVRLMDDDDYADSVDLGVQHTPLDDWTPEGWIAVVLIRQD